jgi:hypothetical protein
LRREAELGSERQRHFNLSLARVHLNGAAMVPGIGQRREW